MTDDEATRVLAEERRQVELLLPVRARARLEGKDAARRRSAPPPSTTRRGVMHLRRAPAYTYAMEIERAKSTAFKIGWAFDFQARERQFNLAALPTIGGLRYRTRLNRLWDTAREAFRMEQALLHRFGNRRHPANQEVITGVSYEEIQAAWIAEILEGRRH